MRAGPQGGDLHVSSSWISLRSVSRACNVFSAREEEEAVSGGEEERGLRKQGIGQQLAFSSLEQTRKWQAGRSQRGRCRRLVS